MELVSKLVLGRGKRVDDSLRAGLGQDRATCHSGGLSGILGGRKKKAFCTGRTDVATVVPGMMAWILDMMCACVRLSASLRLSVEPSLHPQQINHCHISTDGTL